MANLFMGLKVSKAKSQWSKVADSEKKASAALLKQIIKIEVRNHDRLYAMLFLKDNNVAFCNLDLNTKLNEGDLIDPKSFRIYQICRESDGTVAQVCDGEVL